MTTQADFLARIESYLAHHGIKAATFGRLALSDPSFVFDLRNGRDPSLGTVKRIEEFMSSASGVAE